MADKRLFNSLNVVQVSELAGGLTCDEARELKQIKARRGEARMQVDLVMSQNWWLDDVRRARENWARKVAHAESLRHEREQKALGLGGYARKAERAGYVVPNVEIDAYQKFLLDRLKGAGSVATLIRRLLVAAGEAQGLREEWEERVRHSPKE